MQVLLWYNHYYIYSKSRIDKKATSYSEEDNEGGGLHDAVEG